MTKEDTNEEYYIVPGKDVYSIQSILTSLGIQQGDTVYDSSSNVLVRWPFTASFFFETASTAPLENGAEAVPMTESEEQAVKAIQAEIKSYKAAAATIAHQERIKELRLQKKAILDQAQARAGRAKQVLVYKKVLELYDSRRVTEQLPHFARVNWPFKDEMPYFTAGLADFAAAVRAGKKTAITGGPCFFSEHEVDMILTFKDGHREAYDFTTGRRKEGPEGAGEKLTMDGSRDVADIRFESHKTLLTTEEYDSILYLFELAQATGSCLTLPIVDASYEKYIHAVFSPLPEEIRRCAHERFREIARPIIRLYRELVAFFQARYPGVECTLMSGEETELLERYYSRRRPFVEKAAVMRSISSIPEKFESVKDYITLPALPLYLCDVQHVLEVDYLGEADSFIKCRRMHKGAMNLSALLYPIRMSGDGWRNLFQTDIAHKEFIPRTDYGKR